MDTHGFEPGAPERGHRVLDPRITLATRVAFYAVAALSLASFIATLNEIGAFDELRSEGGAQAVQAVADAEQLSDGFVTLVLWVGLAVAVLTIVWWHRAYQAMLLARPIGVRWSPRWAVGAWFIPIGNMVVSKLILNEIDRVSLAAESGATDWRSLPLLRVAGWWWVAWVGGLVVAVYGATTLGEQIDNPAFDEVAYRSGLVALAAAHAASTVAAFLAAASLRILGDRLHRL